jgi:hypothetical protein
MSQCAAEIYRNLAINKCLEYMHSQIDSACCIEDRERAIEAYKEVARLMCVSFNEANEVESFQLPEVI